MLGSVVYYLFLGAVLCFALRALVPRRRRSGLYLRRGGYVEISPRASGSASHTTAPTLTRTATSTGCRRDGQRQAVTDSQATLHVPSRTTARSVSGSSTASHRGDPTTGAE